MFIGLETPQKVYEITVLGQILQVLLQYMVGATPELGPNFPEVSAAGVVLATEEVSAPKQFVFITCFSGWLFIVMFAHSLGVTECKVWR